MVEAGVEAALLDRRRAVVVVVAQRRRLDPVVAPGTGRPEIRTGEAVLLHLILGRLMMVGVVVAVGPAVVGRGALEDDGQEVVQPGAGEQPRVILEVEQLLHGHGPGEHAAGLFAARAAVVFAAVLAPVHAGLVRLRRGWPRDGAQDGQDHRDDGYLIEYDNVSNCSKAGTIFLYCI